MLYTNLHLSLRFLRQKKDKEVHQYMKHAVRKHLTDYFHNFLTPSSVSDFGLDLPL